MKRARALHERIVKVKAPGKCILFGEHAVVYGYPAIAVAINQFSYCHIEKGKSPGISLFLKDFNIHYQIPSFSLKKQIVADQFKQYETGLNLIAERYNLTVEALKITIFSDLWTGAGLGSSASASVAFIAALNDYYELHLSKQAISDLAFEMEKEVHGHPSGIDNAICTFGQIIYFQQGKKETLQIPPNFQMLLTYSGKPHDTKKAVTEVRQLHAEKPETTALLFQNIGDVTQSARDWLKHEDLDKVGELIAKNQQLLESLKVSSPEIHQILTLVSKHSKCNAKLTGAGKGGCVVTLGSSSELEKLQTLLETQKFPSILTSINQNGVTRYEE
ncbi:MAG: mevalonate kinase [Promethearchaeota archaeon]